MESAHSLDMEKVVFLDESGVNIDMARRYGRSIGKTRVIDHVPCNTPKKTTIVSSIRLSGKCAYRVLEGSMTGNHFKDYVEQVLVPTLCQEDIVVMDNLSCHKVAGIEQMISMVGARIIYLPPYSPDMNPIEKMWSKLKAFLRKWRIRTTGFLPGAIDKAIRKITKDDCRGWFTCCGYSICEETFI